MIWFDIEIEFKLTVRNQGRKDHAENVVFSYTQNSQEWKYRKVSTYPCRTQFLTTQQRNQGSQL
jgi:hypothetical protein